MENVLFNTKEGFWHNYQGYTYTDEEATTYDADVGIANKSNDSIELYVPKGIIKHQDTECFLRETLAPIIASNRRNIVAIFFHREMEVEPTFEYTSDVKLIVTSFEDASRDTLLRLCEQHTPILGFKDDYDGFWFITDKDIKPIIRAVL